MSDKILIEYIQLLGLTNEEFAKYLGISIDTLKNWLYRTKKVPEKKVSFVFNKIKLHPNYTSGKKIDRLLTNESYNLDMYDYSIPESIRQIQPNKAVDTVDFLDIPDLEDENLESFENSFGNKFVKLPTGGYLMYMPFFEWDVAASLLDNDGDTRHPDYEDVAQHVTIVDEPLKGKYAAFRIKGGSMEGTDILKYIPDGSIVWGRELQRVHWRDKLRINKYPLWVVGSTEFGRPTLKEIKIHDLETATIVVDSWNPSKEYAHNVAVSLNTVKMLYYVMKVETSISHIK